MIHIFWDFKVLCDYLSLKGLFYNSVTYQILLNTVNTHKEGVLNGNKEQ